MGFRILVSLHPAIQTTGLLTFAPAGLSPAEHTSLYWTHIHIELFPFIYPMICATEYFGGIDINIWT
jgi:hypothetical protein